MRYGPPTLGGQEAERLIDDRVEVRQVCQQPGREGPEGFSRLARCRLRLTLFGGITSQGGFKAR